MKASTDTVTPSTETPTQVTCFAALPRPEPATTSFEMATTFGSTTTIGVVGAIDIQVVGGAARKLLRLRIGDSGSVFGTLLWDDQERLIMKATMNVQRWRPLITSKHDGRP
eukprot:202973_1